MPRRNRVTPLGTIIETPARGALMGNRGVLHDAHGVIRRHHQGRRWIYCLLDFRSRHRTVMTPGRYTELFFLDEATALAAGHRPCAECQRVRFAAFAAHWPPSAGSILPRADVIDAALHRARLMPTAVQRTFVAAAADLPAGVFVLYDQQPHLLWQQRLHPWTPFGYRPGVAVDPSVGLTVLTPRPTVAVLHAGFLPAVHTSLEQSETSA